jgi:hypothetical protein
MFEHPHRTCPVAAISPSQHEPAWHHHIEP